MLISKVLKHTLFGVLFLVLCSYADPKIFQESSSMKSRGNVSLQPNIAESAIDSLYELGPGDFLDIFLENAYFSVQVNPDQTIIIDEVGAIEVGGKPFFEAKKIILEKI